MKKTILFLTLILFSVKGFSQLNYPSVVKGVTIISEDKKVKMNLSFRVQSLASYSNSTEGDDAAMTAMIRRMRLKSKGYIYDPKFEYKLELALSNRDVSISSDAGQVSNASKIVLDAVLKYHLNDNSQIWFGQTKLPGNRERVISSRDLQFVDRSLVNSRFNIDRDFGVQYRNQQTIGKMPLVISAAVTTGEGRNITAVNHENGLAYTGRLEVYPFGFFTSKGDYFGADLKRETSKKLALGISFCENKKTNRSGGQLGRFITDSLGIVSTDISTLFVDLMYKYKGVSVMAEYANKQTPSVVSGFNTGSGYNGQIGYLFNNNYEIAARYTKVDVESTSITNTTDEYTLGVSKYIQGHMLKCQADVSYDVYSNSSNSSTSNGYRFRFQLEFGI